MVAHVVRDDGVAGSNPVIPTLMAWPESRSLSDQAFLLDLFELNVGFPAIMTTQAYDQPMRKKTLGAVVALALLSTANTPALALSSFGSSSLGSSGGDYKKTAPEYDKEQGLDVTMIGDLLGLGISDHLGVLAGDLGEMAPINGTEFAIIFGDSFRGRYLGEGEWMSPVGAVAEMVDGKITLKRPLNGGDRVEQLINYQHNDRGLTLLPSDVINVDGTLYMQAMWNEGVGNVLSTEIWKSTDSGKTWSSVTRLPANYMGGMGNLISWERGADGWIYMVSSQFKRADNVYLSRFHPTDFGHPERWEHYDRGVWGANYSPILNARAGEMSLRLIEGRWVLAMFNAGSASIEVRISDRIDRDWNELKPAHVVAGWDGWNVTQNENNFTQLYGGYIVPGSTIANMDIVVSQWNTTTHRRYNSTQFNIKGLENFPFEQSGQARALHESEPAENQLQVTVSEVDDSGTTDPIAIVPSK